MFSKLLSMIAILAVLYLQQAACLPNPQYQYPPYAPPTQGGYYPPISTQPIFPPAPPPRTASPSWQSKLRCSGQYNGLDYNDCQNAFKGLIDQSFPGVTPVSSIMIRINKVVPLRYLTVAFQEDSLFSEVDVVKPNDDNVHEFFDFSNDLTNYSNTL
ncbi:uncharacterized protein MELLADRAFT_60448 [Melampsora larici-populina 98AG31]|uniref:Secreted protein n=1 Tax=Melampsora larici-populina (strain 98AG31 / pathotype 3-4-7) TaxID=747676 RepID=F4RB76_MELLP|nr:uncharacterized protein MELLADRAFT_60448 [Melampsora larici-populina 98AG31]EGG10031.1 hypothetical protein MELLADRAFT_60448 [Melampsora larici-populina 98AG31]